MPLRTHLQRLQVIDNIRYFAESCGVDRQAADEVIEAVDLRDHRTAVVPTPATGGQRPGSRWRVRWSAGLIC